MPDPETATTDPEPYDDPFDRVEERTEERVEHWVDVFARRLHIASRFTAHFVFPLVLLVGGIVLIALLQLGRMGRYAAFLAAYFLPFGILAGVPAALELGIHPVVIVATVLWVDLWGTLFLVWNLALLERVPWLGPRIARLEARAEKVWQRSKRLRDLGIVGLGLFVAIPLTATGAVPGSLIGRLAGFPWALTWLAVFLGSAVRILAYTAAWYGAFEVFF